MKRPLSHRLILKPLLLALLFAGLQCEKKKDEPVSITPQAKPGAAPVAPVVPARAASLTDHAAKLGFAAHLPQETEFYLGSVNLKTHLTNLKNSAWWKEINGLVQDKMPAPTAGDKSFATLEKLWGDDVFIAGGQGFAATATQWRTINRVYNEVYFKMLMAGSASGATGATGGTPEIASSNPLLYLQMFLQDPATLEKVAAVIGTFELPPLLAGFKVDKPDEILAVLNDTKQFEDKKIFVMSDLTTPQGHKFRVATVNLASLLPETDKQTALSNLPPETPDASRKIIEKAYDDLQKKKILLAWGAVEGHVILACGQNLDHLKFAAGPAQSLLAKPEMDWLVPHAEKNLAAITYASAASLSALNDDQPFIPMLRGVVSALKENRTFKGLGETLEKQVTELSPLESKVYNSESTNLTAAAWWDRGLHIETTGGVKPQFLLTGKPLHFDALVNRPGVVFGIAYQRNMEHEQAIRAWTEKLFGMAFTTAEQLVSAGIAGDKGKDTFDLFAKGIVPQLLNIYQADKDMNLKGLGTETAYILDLNGKMPPLPGVPDTMMDLKFPRLSIASEVSNSAEITKSWQTVSNTLLRLSGIAALLNGGGEGGKPLLSFEIPEPETTQIGDMTTWYFTGKMLNGDLSPSAGLSEKLLLLSTSKDATEAFATDLAKPKIGASVDGAVWRLDPEVLVNWLDKLSAATQKENLAPTGTEADTTRMVLKWLKPFHALRGHLYQEKGQWRVNLDWDVTDVVKFD